MATTRERTKKSAEPKLGRRNAAASGPGPEELARIALDLFAERHFSSVSIRDIGRAAKVNSSMIYYHYRDKEDLFRAAIETAIAEAFQLFSDHCSSAAHEDAVDAIDNWLDVHVTLHKQLRSVIKISMDCKGVIGVHDEPIKRFYRYENKMLEGIIREGIEKGLFRKVDPPVVAAMISTMLDGTMARSFFLKDFDMVRTVDEFKRAIRLHLGYKELDRKASANTRKVTASQKQRKALGAE